MAFTIWLGMLLNGALIGTIRITIQTAQDRIRRDPKTAAPVFCEAVHGTILASNYAPPTAIDMRRKSVVRLMVFGVSWM